MDYLILSLTLLAIGVYGLVTKYSLLKTIISIEILATATTMNFVLILAFSTDICVSSIVAALLVIVSRRYGTTDIRELARLIENKDLETGQQSSSEGD
jgi:NADH:ubiquinone oxidoreductase subunit K